MKLHSLSGAITATLAIFIVLCLVSIDNSLLSVLRSKQHRQRTQLGLASIAPDGLPLAAKILQASIPVQDPNFPINSLTKLPAWATLQSTLSAYAERIKLLDAQEQELDQRLQQRSWWTVLAMLVTIIVNAILVTAKGILVAANKRRLNVAQEA